MGGGGLAWIKLNFSTLFSTAPTPGYLKVQNSNKKLYLSPLPIINLIKLKDFEVLRKER